MVQRTDTVLDRKNKARRLYAIKCQDKPFTIGEMKKQNEILKRIVTNENKEIQEMLDLVFEEGYTLGFVEGIDSVFELEEEE